MANLPVRKIQGYGWRPDTPDHRDFLFAPEVRPAHLPLQISLRDRMPAVYDQGQLGSCTGNAIAAAMEFAEVSTQTPSRLFIYYGEREIEGTINEDAGAEIRDGLKVVANVGAPPETDWAYDIARFTERPPEQAYTNAAQHKAISYSRITPGYGRFRAALAAGHPIVFGFSVPESFESGQLANGQTTLVSLPQANEQIIGGHAVLAVGYDFTKTRFPVNVVEVRNSWGADWCDSGYCYMDAAWFTDHNLTSDLWTIRRAS